MRAAVPLRVLGFWAALSALFGVLPYVAARAWPDGWRASLDLWLLAAVVQFLGVPFVKAYAESVLLRRHGRPVRGWTLKVGSGTILIRILNNVFRFAFARWAIGWGATGGGAGLEGRVIGWAYVLAAASLASLGIALVVGLAVWGRRWPSTWMFWIAGRIGLGLLVAGLGSGFSIVQPGDAGPSRILGAGLTLQGAEGLGEAWLLWRFVLPLPDSTGSHAPRATPSSPMPDSASPDSPQP